MDATTQKAYFELLRFQSVGGDPTKLRDCADCALWLKKWLQPLGFDTEIMMPPLKSGRVSPPVLFGVRQGDEGAPTVLVYGHYDVQPVDPVGAWKTPPFEPTVIDGRIYCRGAQDDKGQLFAFLCGMADFLSAAPAGRVPTIKILVEGQEESGSAALLEMVSDMRKKVAADVLLVCDTNAAPGLRPAIIAGLRGAVHFAIRLRGANRDLHSGEYGGIAPNAAQALAELVASLHNPDGSIAVFGFRDGIEQPSHEEQRLGEAFAPGEAEVEDDIGCPLVGGQLGKTVAQRNSFEPTIEVNGIASGYNGPGVKTVIPCEAVAKMSLRLVPGQTTRGAMEAVRRHLEEHCPRGMKLEVEQYGEGAPGFRLPLDSPIFRLASSVLESIDPRGPVFRWDGASIPVVSRLREVSGAAPLLVGWGQTEDRIHSPGESYSLVQFDRAREWGRRILASV